MAQIDNNLKQQLAKPQTWFCKYFPKRIRNVGEKEIADRQMVYDFKDGRSFEAVAQITATSMKEQYGEKCSGIVFVPVPASTNEKNELRYKAFCERVCELTGAINGFDHIKVIGGRLAIHENRPNRGRPSIPGRILSTKSAVSPDVDGDVADSLCKCK